MLIQKTNNISFTAKYTFAKSKVKQNFSKDAKKNLILYNDIKTYLSKDCSKIEYLNKFSKNFNTMEQEIKYNNAEKKYINNLLITLDLSENWKKIPDNSLKESMQELLNKIK